ncbi:hypothetical protein ALNOE001_06100 [Candidatus Methanobinarius endosymbioticus]|uniref:Uncharacterized protein n=1 Tax=Candidatus Methanobinarius endosymbioticus TaxID=2006182 RepID=A0A366MEM4_9EURY|nr:hypothetical protein ALNOE001_06100 [Candidatus Methanobinarius endosymbioticus]
MTELAFKLALLFLLLFRLFVELLSPNEDCGLGTPNVISKVEPL